MEKAVDDIVLAHDLTGRGPMLMLVHELGGTRRSWDDAAQMLSTRFRVITFDQRGCGETMPSARPFRFDDLVADIARLVDRLDITEPFLLAGVGTGAAQALAFTARHPDRVSALALLNPALEMGPDRLALMAERAQRARSEGMAGVGEMALQRAWPAAYRDPSGPFAGYRACYLAADAQSYALHSEAVADVAGLLARITCPLLLAAGSDDVVRPAPQVRALAQSAGADFASVKAAHFMHLQAPRDTAVLLKRFFDLAQNGQTDWEEAS